MTQFTPLQSYGHESRERITMPALPWASATQPQEVRRAMTASAPDRLALRAESDNARRPVKPDADPHEVWFAIRSHEAAKRDGHRGALPKIAEKNIGTPIRERRFVKGPDVVAIVEKHGCVMAREVGAEIGLTTKGASLILSALARSGEIKCLGLQHNTLTYGPRDEA